MRVLLSPLARAPLPTRVFFFFFFFFLPSFPPPLPFAIRQSALFFSLLLCYKFQFSSMSVVQREAQMEKARVVKENKTRWGSSLFLSLSRCRARFFGLARSRFSAACQSACACCIRVCVTFFPGRVFSQLFFFLSYKFRVFESFQGPLKRIRFQKRHSFGLFLPNTPLQRERERERGRHEDSLENAVRRALETFSGAALFSFVAFDGTLFWVSSFRNGFLFSSPLFL